MLNGYHSRSYKNEKEKFFLLCYRQKTKMEDEDEISRLRDEGL